MPSDRKAASRRWYQKLKSDPARYLAWAERNERYAEEHKEHLKETHRKSDRKRHKEIMADPVRHEAYLAYRRELHRKRMQDPAYREKLRKRAEANNAKRRALLQSNPELRKRYNEEAAARSMARRDFLKATPEGRIVLKEEMSDRYVKAISNPVRHEKIKAASRRHAAKYRKTEKYRQQVEMAKELRRKRRRKNERNRAYRKANAERIRKLQREWIERNPEKYRQQQIRKNENLRARLADPVVYADYRRKKREYLKRKRMEQGKKYTPRPQCRVPDHCAFGEALDRTSPYLRNNLSPDKIRSADAFAKEKAREEREYSHSNNLS